jgi:acyl transferase domain-containing protein
MKKNFLPRSTLVGKPTALRYINFPPKEKNRLLNQVPPAPASPGTNRRVAFLFSGQGGQYPGMGRELYETHAAYRRAIDTCDGLLQAYQGISLTRKLYQEEQHAVVYSQTALFAVEYALSQLWLSWGVKPAVLLGHSVGEYAAACAAGVFRPADALKLLSTRDQLLDALPDPGRMAVVFAGVSVVDKFLAGYRSRVAIAAINGPANTILSGDGEAITILLQQIRNQGFHVQDLASPFAYHSPLTGSIRREWYRVASTLSYAPAALPVISTLTGRLLLPGDKMDARYWCDQVTQPVLFADAVQALERRGDYPLLEIGPSPMLLAMGSDLFTGPSPRLPSLRKGRPEGQQMQQSLARLQALGAVGSRSYDKKINGGQPAPSLVNH